MMRHLVLLCIPAIFGMVFAGGQSSGQQKLDYDPLVGPGNTPNGPAVVQNHGAVGNPVAAAMIPQGGSSGNTVDYNLLEGPPKTPNGPLVNQQHGYNGAPQVGVIPQGGSSNDDNGGAGGALGGVLNPQIIPSFGGDSQDNDGGYQQAYGGQGGAVGTGGSSDSGYAAAGNGGAGGNPVAGGSPIAGNPSAGGNAGAGNNAGVDGPKAAPAIGGGEFQGLSENQALTQSGMSGGAIAGVVLGVAGVAAIGTAVAVVALRSGTSVPFSRA